MALSDLVLKAKVDMALARDPRVSLLEIDVRADNGRIILSGDVDSQDKCRVAEQVVRSVNGVRDVENEMTCDIQTRATTANEVIQRFLQKLDEVWNQLPDQTALTQADYLRWALWMIYKFHIPDTMASDDQAQLEDAAMDSALVRLGQRINTSPALLALEMLRQAQEISESLSLTAPEIETLDLTATPMATEAEMPVGAHAARS